MPKFTLDQEKDKGVSYSSVIFISSSRAPQSRAPNPIPTPNPQPPTPTKINRVLLYPSLSGGHFDILTGR